MSSLFKTQRCSNNWSEYSIEDVNQVNRNENCDVSDDSRYIKKNLYMKQPEIHFY